MGWGSFKKKFRSRIKKFGRNAIPIVGAVAGIAGIGVVANLANNYAARRAGVPTEQEAVRTQGPGLQTSAATAQATREVTESFPFNLPGIGGVLKSIFG